MPARPNATPKNNPAMVAHFAGQQFSSVNENRGKREAMMNPITTDKTAVQNRLQTHQQGEGRHAQDGNPDDLLAPILSPPVPP